MNKKQSFLIIFLAFGSGLLGGVLASTFFQASLVHAQDNFFVEQMGTASQPSVGPMDARAMSNFRDHTTVPWGFFINDEFGNLRINIGINPHTGHPEIVFYDEHGNPRLFMGRDANSDNFFMALWDALLNFTWFAPN